ncbi:MAG: site-specific integrase [Planctomycetes bacterium]|nr:site-specific integrase [Planctomycetota bacterium]
MQACLDTGNRPATINKKIRGLKRLFQLALRRGQLEENPLKFVKKLRVGKQKFRTYDNNECKRIVKVAQQTKIGAPFKWDILILTALCTAMRSAELLNLVWEDIDFEKSQINITPKEETETTWQWTIKDMEQRSVPLIEEILQLLIQHQAEQPNGYPYVFIPPNRYDVIQKLRKKGKWFERHQNRPVNNFRRQFNLILSKAGVKQGKFHDFRRTCISKWFANGLSEFDVMNMAGHSNFETTRNYYLAVREGLLDKARTASSHVLQGISIANSLQLASSSREKKNVSLQHLANKELTNHARQDLNLRPTD